MRQVLPLLALLCIQLPAPAAETDLQRELADRVAIEEVMHKYIWTIDSLDADGYVSVFTEDAEITTSQTQMKGHAAIRKMVTDMQASQAANRAAGKPVGALYHVVSNERISFTGPGEAVYQSYWQTMRKDDTGRYVTGGFGRSEDHLVKRDGRWLIRHRKLSTFKD